MDDGGFIDQLVAACNAEGEACKGFTTFGKLKSEIQRPNDWTTTSLLCYGLYVRDTVPVTCGGLPGYEFYPNKDSPGNDIQRMELSTANELAAACNADANCEGEMALLLRDLIAP